MNFGSDNQTGASPQVLEAIMKANDGFLHGYGDEDYTRQTVEQLKRLFDCDLEAYFIPTGTAANCLALSSLVNPWQTILCHPEAHIIQDENTAPELLTGGARLKAIATEQPKIHLEDLKKVLSYQAKEAPHNSLAGAMSLTQCTELGQAYQPEEVKQLCLLAHQHGLSVHMDGARFSNAVAHLGCHPKEISWQAGVDVLCLGATKNGALAAEAVIFFNKELAVDFEQRRKRAGHLLSKGRLFSAQFQGWLENDHWLELATHANRMAEMMAKGLSEKPGCRIIFPVEANELFVTLPKSTTERLQQHGAEFYEWPTSGLAEHLQPSEGEQMIRLVTSFITKEHEVKQFCDLI
ncbi:threonine aldolase family protein [Litoribacillus peritrichatus]|uniref:Low specificity L-threonine aldolase n=1 Tax=Litoribacillus peritrichatus TaxID=718191 RepID=A0ABP7NA11_9GAMM